MTDQSDRAPPVFIVYAPEILAKITEWSCQGYYASEIAKALGLRLHDVTMKVNRLRRNGTVPKPRVVRPTAGQKDLRGLPRLPEPEPKIGAFEPETQVLARSIPEGEPTLAALPSIKGMRPPSRRALLGPAPECQTVMERGRMCGAKSIPGKSYCEDHNRIFYIVVPKGCARYWVNV